ncbi:ABC transporter substrate-binding protein [Synechococcus sp. WH 8016]|jgi:ABC-type branched-subunit amino acid transport system substrate-binding protein|uniref:ABC transporter substrate-binding protein n=1 Tax=Synechococcus sp. WH 8016 TaxID=166318 RepID=UPI000237D6AF|nr:ABC transporter substrate-binding protein [Synechococcus sp. WH 8016]EHA61803.1 Extracellular ligand-binding receptor [Synechococcus sp. WH 8016]
MAFQGRPLPPPVAIVLGLSIGGALFAIWSGVNLTTNQEPFEPAPNTSIASNEAERSVASENLDSLLNEEPRPWLLAQSLPLKGPSGHIGERFALGIDTVLRELNNRGGIAGRPVKVWRIDDGYEPENTLRNTRFFAAEPDVLALFGFFGTPTSKAALPIAKTAGLTLVAPLTGASALRAQGQTGVLHFRASYAEEARRIVNHLVNDGFVRIAVAYQNDAYGKDVLASTVEALKKHNLSAVSTAALPRNSIETKQAADTIIKSKPDALIVISLSKTMASLVNNLHRNGSRPQLMTISPTGTKALFRDLPQAAAFGVGVTQVVPFPWDARHPDVASYQRLLRQQQQDGEVDFDFYSLEGFMAAQWLVEAMESIAPDINRDRLVDELRRTTPGLHRSIDLVFLGSDPWEP